MTIAAEKKDEKVEKRRALGRGLESLLPGPRVVAPSREGAPVPSGAEGGETKVPRFARDDNPRLVIPASTSRHAFAIFYLST